MATVAGAGGGKMLPRRRRLPLGDLTNLPSSTSVVTRLKPAARSKPRSSPTACSSTSSIGSSTVPRCAPPPPPPPPLSVAVIKGKDKPTRELQSSTAHLKKIRKISKPKVKTGDILPVASSPPSKKTRKVTRGEPLHMDPLDQSSGELPWASSPPSKKTRKVTREEPLHMDLFDQSSGEPLPPSQDFIEERRAYFAEIDAFEMVEEFVSSGSDLQ
ncbi:uncharacterized protein LOC124666107 isoform X2 [Lolium rigidum]|uniref:uncharacterized protein LOC124666107 isoform X2 n=1 Tax=Lolium rigidum TaxID=89674 RepID=UPI001F5E0CC4|nr:uncharacterized protein LOC124666107 isoform X2 [Lolium rigidum]